MAFGINRGWRTCGCAMSSSQCVSNGGSRRLVSLRNSSRALGGASAAQRWCARLRGRKIFVHSVQQTAYTAAGGAHCPPSSDLQRIHSPYLMHAGRAEGTNRHAIAQRSVPSRAQSQVGRHVGSVRVDHVLVRAPALTQKCRLRQHVFCNRIVVDHAQRTLQAAEFLNHALQSSRRKRVE